LLQQDGSFKHKVRGLLRENSFNRELVTDFPQSPTLGSKQKPIKSLCFSQKQIQNIKKLGKGCGIPLNREHRANPAQKKFS
jgi:hypothetical protein